MSLRDLAEEIEEVRMALDHRRRSRNNIERAKLHISHNIEDARRDLDAALQVARRAQIAVEEEQKKFELQLRRLSVTDKSLEEIADEELQLANRLRDLSHQLTKGPKEESADKQRNGGGRSNLLRR